MRHPPIPFRTPRRLVITTILLAILWPAAAQAQSAVPVVVAETRREHVVEELPLTGTVTARQNASLSPRASGLVSTVHVDAGDHVEAGAPLVTLDDTLAKLAVKRAEAALVETRARLAESERLRNEARQLLDKRTIAETEARTREAELNIATAAATRLEVELAESREQLARHTVIAPFAGVVTRKLTEAGEWVQTGTAVIELVAIKGARVDVQVPQERLADITADTPVRIHIDARPDAPALPGRVIARVPVSDPTTRTALVRVEPTDDSAPLLPGKSARVLFRLRSAEPLLAVPRDALVRRPDGTVNVWVATREGDAWTASPRRVDLGRAYGDHVEIRDGLEAGRHVIIRGNETLRDGQSVRIDEQPAS